MNDLIIKDLKKSYGEKMILHGLSLTVPGGRTTCIGGESGCGKTTLLRILAGLEPYDSGTIDGLPERIAFVFQEDRLCEDFSALSNIRLVCGSRKMREKIPDQKIREHLQELGLAEDAARPVRDYSGGMKRRVAIARAICYDADLILMDEPFTGLDELRKTEVMDYVLRHTEGKTVICVTHDPAEAEYLGGNILTMKRIR